MSSHAEKLRREHAQRRAEARRQLIDGLIVSALYYLSLLAILAGVGLLGGLIERIR